MLAKASSLSLDNSVETNLDQNASDLYRWLAFRANSRLTGCQTFR